MKEEDFIAKLKNSGNFSETKDVDKIDILKYVVASAAPSSDYFAGYYEYLYDIENAIGNPYSFMD